MNRVTVYFGEVWDQQKGRNVRTLNKATETWLTKIGAEIVRDTAEVVEASQVDGEGRYIQTRPV